MCESRKCVALPRLPSAPATQATPPDASGADGWVLRDGRWCRGWASKPAAPYGSPEFLRSLASKRQKIEATSQVRMWYRACTMPASLRLPLTCHRLAFHKEYLAQVRKLHQSFDSRLAPEMRVYALICGAVGLFPGVRLWQNVWSAPHTPCIHNKGTHDGAQRGA